MWEAIRSNKRRSAFLIGFLAALLVGLGYLIAAAIHPSAGPLGAGAALLIWLALLLTALAGGRQVLLGSVNAREIQHDDYPVLFNVVEEMTIAAGLPKVPRVFILDTDAPNAFAVGSEENSAVAVTTGLLIRLSRDELQGVVAHEIGHIKNHDSRFMTLAGVMVAAIVLIADAFLRTMFVAGRGRRRPAARGGGGAQVAFLLIALALAILAPLVAQVLYVACSRRREYLADACAAQYTRYPEGLASALEKIARSARHMKDVNRAVAPMFTVNPLKPSGAESLFSTHPPTEKRIRVLRSMAGGAAFADYEAAYARLSGHGLLGKRTLAESRPLATRPPSAEPEKSELAKAREAVDILHRLDGMLFLACPCGLRTKVPPSFKGKEIHCPRCGRVVPVPAAAFAALAAVRMAEGPAPEDTSPGAGQPVFKRKAGRWETFRCPCGRTIQLSPSFSADRVQCPACGRVIRVESSAPVP